MRGRLISLIWKSDPRLYAPAKYRRACRYEAFVPDGIADADFTFDARVAGTVSDAEHAIRDLNASAGPELAAVSRLLLRTESIASSKVEGLQVSVRDLARAEGRLEADRRVSATAREVLANVDAMELAIHEAAAAGSFSMERIRAIHARLMEVSPNPEFAGRIRSVQNWIGGNDYNPCGADFVPPPPEHVEGLMDDLCQAVNDESLPPLVQAAVVHAQFETIHPFEDGNGRTGRALVHVILHRRGIAPRYVPPISVMLASDREGYVEGLVRYRSGEVERWLQHFATATARSADLAGAYVDSTVDLMDRWRTQLEEAGAPRADAAAWAVIDILPSHPVITASVSQDATGSAKSAIHQALGELAAAGVLLPLSASKRNRSWEAAGLLDLLEGLERGTLP